MTADLIASAWGTPLSVAAVLLFLVVALLSFQQYFMFQACKNRVSACEKKLEEERIKARIEMDKHARCMSRLAASVSGDLATIDAEFRDLAQKVASMQSRLAAPHETRNKVKSKGVHHEERVLEHSVCLTASLPPVSPLVLRTQASDHTNDRRGRGIAHAYPSNDITDQAYSRGDGKPRHARDRRDADMYASKGLPAPLSSGTRFYCNVVEGSAKRARNKNQRASSSQGESAQFCDTVTCSPCCLHAAENADCGSAKSVTSLSVAGKEESSLIHHS